jgi:hypothetical protein
VSHYKAKGNAIVDATGRQVAVVLPTGCTKKLAREMAAYAAQQANHAERRRQLSTEGDARQGKPESRVSTLHMVCR